jgi:hypothetical protein
MEFLDEALSDNYANSQNTVLLWPVYHNRS